MKLPHPTHSRLKIFLFALFMSQILWPSAAPEKSSFWKCFLDQPEEGWKNVQEALETNDDDRLRSLSLLYAIKFSKDPRFPFLKGTFDLLESKSLSSATRYLDKASRLEKNSPYTQAASAALKILNEDEDLTAAYSQIESIIEKNPHEALIRLLFANLSYRASCNESMRPENRDNNEFIQNALYHYRQCLKDWKNAKGGYLISINLAALIESRGSFEEELFHRENAAQYHFTLHNTSDLAERQFAFGKEKEAFQTVEKMFQKFPKSCRPYLTQGLLFKEQGKWKEALDVFRKGLNLCDNEDDLWIEVGYVQEKLGNFPEAEKAYIKTLEHNSHSFLARRRLRFLYENRGAFDEAWVLEQEKPIDPNKTLSKDVFFRAIQHNQTETVEKILKNNPSLIEKRDPDAEDQTPLMKAVQFGATKTALFLIEKSADLHALDKDGSNLCHYAAYFSRTYLLQKFLDMGLDPWKKDERNRTAGMNCISQNNPESIELLLQKYPIKNHHNEYQKILLWAAGWGRLEQVKLLIQSGLSINAPDLETGEVPLMTAARWEKRSVLHYLFTQGADIRAIDKKSQNVLHYLFMDKETTPNIEFYRWLVKKGAHPQQKNFEGKTPESLLEQSIAKKFLLLESN